jgi:hypothetical protein
MRTGSGELSNFNSQSKNFKQMSKSNEVFCLVQSPNFSLPFRRASLAETR